ncbi:unnamed protein product [Ectocarpus sp. 12 AP-2014]
MGGGLVVLLVTTRVCVGHGEGGFMFAKAPLHMHLPWFVVCFTCFRTNKLINSSKHSCVHLRTGDGVCSLRCGHPLEDCFYSGLNFHGTLPSREDERPWYSSIRRRSNIHDTLPSREGEEYPWYPSVPPR